VLGSNRHATARHDSEHDVVFPSGDVCGSRCGPHDMIVDGECEVIP
jgi:hypothetical protein